MGNASYVQSDFRGGQWSARSQGMMADPMYKKGMAVCSNSVPLYQGSWTRRSGFLFGGNTRQGKLAKLIGIFLKLTEPLQLEFTDGYLRAHVGNGFVFTSDIDVTIASISTANPAVVTVNGTLPSTWSNYDTVTLDLIAQPGQPSAPSAPILCGRQFQIQGITTNTFALYDSLTGASIDGSTFSYTAPTLGGADYVYKIAEVTTPYSQADIESLRAIHTETIALLLNGSFQPQQVTVPPIGNLALTPVSFVDGPYLDINVTATTLTPSGTSGNVTFSASSVVGINGGNGFQQSDVGRALRFQSEPPNWSSTTTYGNTAIVTGSDNNIYQSVVGNNTNNDPTTDNGTHWVVTGQTIIWVWGYITTVNSTTQVVVAIQPAAGSNGETVPGNVLISTNASASWALGLYSQTTGWPTTGTYHEGRFWLAGSIIPNRFDCSVSDDPLNFSPTAPDGTVGDANAITYPFNAEDDNTIVWMLPGAGGVLCGTTTGEWMIRASQLGDPITLTSIQAHKVSRYGCANIEPQIAELVTVFVQREQQRIMDFANYPYGETAGFFATNLSEKAEDICAPGIAEIRWQQEPSHFLWARGNDGSLFGTTFSHAAYGKESYNGWHEHDIGGGRTVASISTGPMANGVSSTLYCIAYNPTTTYYEYLMLAPVFDDSQPQWATCFTDGTAFPCAPVIMNTNEGGSFNGVRIYGLYNIIGQTVSPVIGGLDLGALVTPNDYVVQGPDGHIDIPFSGAFTLAFLEAFNNGTDYGVYALPIQASYATSYDNSGMGAYSGSTANQSDVAARVGLLVPQNDELIAIQSTGIRVYALDTLNEDREATWATIFYNGPNTQNAAPVAACYHPGTNAIYMNCGNASNSSPICRIGASSLRVEGTFGSNNSSFTPGPANFPTIFNTMIPFSTLGTNYIAFVSIASSSTTNWVGVLDADTMSYVGATQCTSDAEIFLCPGPKLYNLWYGIGTAKYGSAQTTPIGIYYFEMTQANFVEGNQNFTQMLGEIGAFRTGQLTPANIDATWTNISAVTGPAYDTTDGNLLIYVSTTDSVTNKNYWLKVHPASATIVWKTATAYACPFNQNNMCELLMPAGQLMYAGTDFLYTLNTETGNITSAAFPAVTDVSANQMYWPETQSVIASVSVDYTSPPVLLGTYMQTHTSFTGWGLLTGAAPGSNVNWPPPEVFDIPFSLGVSFTSTGQLLRPDFGEDAGTRAGPAFGKKRRVHWYAAAVERSQNFQISTNSAFPADSTDTVVVEDEDENVVLQPLLYTGTISSTMPDNYSFDGQIAWQVSRPTPLTVTAMGGYIASADK